MKALGAVGRWFRLALGLERVFVTAWSGVVGACFEVYGLLCDLPLAYAWGPAGFAKGIPACL